MANNKKTPAKTKKAKKAATPAKPKPKKTTAKKAAAKKTPAKKAAAKKGATNGPVPNKKAPAKKKAAPVDKLNKTTTSSPSNFAIKYAEVKKPIGDPFANGVVNTSNAVTTFTQVPVVKINVEDKPVEKIENITKPAPVQKNKKRGFLKAFFGIGK